MLPPLNISSAPPEHPAMDFQFLRQEGIQHLARLAGQVWTDFNAHDPGITILEQVCYALTDLSHRINYSLPDLLTQGDAPTYADLYGPAQILSTNPVTPLDLRKLVIDVPGIKNAWIEPVTTQANPLYYRAGDGTLSLTASDLAAEPVHLRGLYSVLIELSDTLYAEANVAQQQEAYRQAVYRLHSYRGLCEDFEAIRVLDPEWIQVRANIEIAAVDDAEAVLLNIYQRLANHISPPVPFYSLSERQASGQRIDEIFNGPLLQHGFIDSDELQSAQRRAELRSSDLIQELMDVPGVLAVRTISIANGGAARDWLLELDPARSPKLDIENSRIILERNRLPATLDHQRVSEAYYLWQRAAADRTNLNIRALDPPEGRDRHVGNYYSIQHQFPDTYGIGAAGLPASTSAQRRAQAKQLQAYLLFFDQLLANYFAQLAHARDLFSFSGQTSRTYFAQDIDDPALGLDGLRGPEHSARLQAITEAEQTGLERRNRFLNHLLARFAEQFTDYSLILFGALQESDQVGQKLVDDKQAFLQDYPALSSGRGTGHNYLLPRDDDNISGLERRLRRKLGAEGEEARFYVVEHILLRPMEGDAGQEIPFLVNPTSRDPLSLQVSLIFPNWPQRYQYPGFRQFVERAVREETPAHLIPSVYWLDAAEMEVFEAVYYEWLDRRRSYWSGA